MGENLMPKEMFLGTPKSHTVLIWVLGIAGFCLTTGGIHISPLVRTWSVCCRGTLGGPTAGKHLNRKVLWS